MKTPSPFSIWVRDNLKDAYSGLITQDIDFIIMHCYDFLGHIGSTLDIKIAMHCYDFLGHIGSTLDTKTKKEKLRVEKINLQCYFNSLLFDNCICR